MLTRRAIVSGVGATLAAPAVGGAFERSSLTPEKFGATGNGVSDDAPALAKMALEALRTNQAAYIPGRRYRVNSTVTLYTNTICDGVIVRQNNGFRGEVVNIAPAPGDIVIVSTAELEKWGTSLLSGASKIPEAGALVGWYVFAFTHDQILLVRKGNPNLAFGDGFEVTNPDGRIAPPLLQDWQLPWKNFDLRRKAVRQPVMVSGLTVELDGEEASESQTGLSVSRPNVILDHCTVRNTSYAPVQAGFSANATCHVSFRNCSSEGMQAHVTNYGFNSNTSAFLSYIDCRQNYCRRGLDAHRAKGIRVIGGLYPDGVGAHYAWGFVADSIQTIGHNESNLACVLVTGGQVRIINCSLVIHSSGAAFRMRTDAHELAGQLIIENNDMIFDRIGEAYCADLRTRVDAYDTLRPISLPSYVKLRNYVMVARPQTNAMLTILAVGSEATAKNMPRPIRMNGEIDIMNGGLDIGGTAKIRAASIQRPETSVGNYRTTISGFPHYVEGSK